MKTQQLVPGLACASRQNDCGCPWVRGRGVPFAPRVDLTPKSSSAVPPPVPPQRRCPNISLEVPVVRDDAAGASLGALGEEAPRPIQMTCFMPKRGSVLKRRWPKGWWGWSSGCGCPRARVVCGVRDAALCWLRLTGLEAVGVGPPGLRSCWSFPPPAPQPQANQGQREYLLLLLLGFLPFRFCNLKMLKLI